MTPLQGSSKAGSDFQDVKQHPEKCWPVGEDDQNHLKAGGGPPTTRNQLVQRYFMKQIVHSLIPNPATTNNTIFPMWICLQSWFNQFEAGGRRRRILHQAD